MTSPEPEGQDAARVSLSRQKSFFADDVEDAAEEAVIFAEEDYGDYFGLSEKSKTAESPSSRPITIEDMQSSLLNGNFDRKPSKQTGWMVSQHDEQGDFYCLYGVSGIEIGEGSRFGHGGGDGGTVELRCGGGATIKIGKNVFIGDRAIIQAGVNVTIGDGAVLGKGVLIMDRNHHGIGNCATELKAPITIGENAKIGDFTILLMGATVAPGAVVAALAVVTARKAVYAKNVSRLLHVDEERTIRERAANNVPIQKCGPVYDCRAVSVSGKMKNIRLSRKAVTFYLKPWGPPIFSAVKEFIISVSAHSFVHNSAQFCATGGNIIMGEHCMTSWRTCLLTKTDTHGSGNIVIEDMVWMGAMCIILPGTRIGKGSLVAAGAVVQGDFPPFSVIAGHPATVKKTLEPFEGGHGH